MHKATWADSLHFVRDLTGSFNEFNGASDVGGD